MQPIQLSIPGRGATHNPPSRFEPLHVEADLEHFQSNPGEAPDSSRPKTLYFKDSSQSILVHNDSPDIPFECSLNPYRGCEHGCVYCYARPTHNYAGFSSGLDFETRILVKLDAAALLRKELARKSWKLVTVGIGGVTDPYQPIERRLRITRQCLEVFLEFRNPTALVTKNHLITRDLDILSQLAHLQLVKVFVSITSLDPEITRAMEPRTSAPRDRLRTLRQLSAAGVPVGVMVAPVVPAITDHEMPRILQAAAEHGAKSAGYIPMRLPLDVKDLFVAWLDAHFPDRKEKVLSRIRDIRGGKLNDPNFGSRMRGQGQFAEQMHQMFELGCRKAGLNGEEPPLRKDLFRRPEGGQMKLFDV